MPATEFIVATDRGIFHKMRQENPEKILIEAPTAGNSATCKSCAQCPWMAMNSLPTLLHVLEREANEIQVDPEIGKKAITSVGRMLDFAAKAKVNVQPKGDLANQHSLYSGIGPA